MRTKKRTFLTAIVVPVFFVTCVLLYDTYLNNGKHFGLSGSNSTITNEHIKTVEAIVE